MPPPVRTMNAVSVIALDHLELLPQPSFLFSRVLLPKAVRSELFKRRSTGREDRGEAEAVVQAAKVGAMVIVDDPWGRRLAARFDCDFHGTIWVLRRFFELELASSSATRNYFIELLRHGTRLPREVVNEFLGEIGEAPL